MFCVYVQSFGSSPKKKLKIIPNSTKRKPKQPAPPRWSPKHNDDERKSPPWVSPKAKTVNGNPRRRTRRQKLSSPKSKIISTQQAQKEKEKQKEKQEEKQKQKQTEYLGLPPVITKPSNNEKLFFSRRNQRQF